MPIQRDEFQKGRKIPDQEKAALDFLRQYRHQAFTVAEIASSLKLTRGQNWLTDMLTIWNLSTALDRLVAEKELVKKTVDGNTYYMTA